MKTANVDKIACELKVLCDALGHETETPRQREERQRKTSELKKQLIRIFCREWPGGPWKRTSAIVAPNRELFGLRGFAAQFMPPSADVGIPFDHTYCFRSVDGYYGIATHPYNIDAKRRREIDASADRLGLCIEYPDFPSWWYPGHTTFIWVTNLMPA